MTATSIEWATAVFNPIVGCSRIARGCGDSTGGGCYAERWVHRGMQPAHRGLTRSTPSGPRWTGEVRLLPERLVEPLRRRKPERYFCNSLSDVGHDGVPESFFRAMVGVALLAPRHRFIFLSKRAARVRRMMEATDPAECVAETFLACPETTRRADQSIEAMLRIGRSWPPPNLVIGASIATQRDCGEQLYQLLRTPAACRIVSAEPLLERIDLRPWLTDWTLESIGEDPSPDPDAIPWRIHGVLIGGESGPGARPCNVEWIREIMRDCREARVAIFVKQMGALAEEPDLGPGNSASNLHRRLKLHDRAGGEPSEWPADLRVRELPACLELETTT